MGINGILAIIGNVFIGVGLVFMLIGGIGLFILKDFYPRILMASKIDTVGFLSLLIGFMFRHGFSFFSGKLLILMVVMLILNPFVAHIIARSAYISGYEVLDVADENEDLQEDESEGTP